MPEIASTAGNGMSQQENLKGSGETVPTFSGLTARREAARRHRGGAPVEREAGTAER